jgi:accessory gene regulator B
MILFISRQVAKAIHNANPEETSSVERLTALLALQVVNFGVIIASLIIGAVTGQFWGTALSLATFVLLRIYTGGFHFRNLDKCFIVSTVVLSSIPHINLPHVPAVASTIVFAALAQGITLFKGGETT